METMRRKFGRQHFASAPLLVAILGMGCNALDASLGVLVPLRWEGAAVDPEGVRYASSAAMAVYHINQRTAALVPEESQFLPQNFKLEIDIQDSTASPSVAVSWAVSWTDADVHAIIGSFRSEVTGPLALVASVDATPVITFASTASSLSDTTMYPTLSRTVFSDAVVADQTIRYLRAFGWTRVAILQVDDAWGRAFGRDLQLSAKAVGVEVATSASFPIGDREGIDNAISQIADSEARIIVCVAFTADLPTVAASANRFGLLKSGYAWILPDEVSSDSVMAASDDPAKTQSQLAGWFTVSIDTLKGSRRDNFQSALASMPRDCLNQSLGGIFTEDALLGSQCEQYCATMYDAVWTAAIGISRAGHPQGDGSVDKQALLAAMRNASFQGASGWVEFDPDTGERVAKNATIVLKNMKAVFDSEGRPQLSAVIAWQRISGESGSMDRVSETPPLWPGGQSAWELPSEEVECGVTETFSMSTRRCEPCPIGTGKDKVSGQCRHFNGSVGILFPIRWGGPTAPEQARGLRIAATAAMAVYHINHRVTSLVPGARDLLPADFRMVFDVQDTMALSTVAVDHTVAWNQQGTHAIVGSYRSAVTGPLALAASIAATPVMAFAATASSLADRATYPTLSRAIWHDAVLADASVRGFAALGWGRIAVVYVDDAWGRAFLRDVSSTTTSMGGALAISVGFTIGSADSVARAVEAVAQTGARIIFCIVFTSDLADVTAAAQEQGLLGSGYAWVVPEETVADSGLLRGPEHASTRQRMQGWLSTGIDAMYGEEGERFQNTFSSEPLDHMAEGALAASIFDPHAAQSVLASDECGMHCPFVYDAVWTAAIGISRAGHPQGDGSVDKQALLAAIRNASFQGASGWVAYDDEGERELTGIPLFFKNLRSDESKEGHLSLVTTWKWRPGQRRDGVASLERITEDPPLWPGGNVSWSAPLDGTCDPGEYFVRESCVPCPRGTRQEGYECKRCEPGTIGSVEGVTECSPCQEGFASGFGMTECDSCPASSKRGLNSPGVSIDECQCDATFFRFDFDSGSFECRPCPLGVVCEGGGVLPYSEPGFWSIDGGAVAYKCKLEGWCLGHGNCADGHRGVGCGLCHGGFAMDMEGCVICAADEPETAPANYIGLAILMIILFAMWYIFALRPLFVSENASAKNKGREGKLMGCLFAWCAMPISSFSGTLVKLSKDLSVHSKILLSFFQVLGSLLTFAVEWPNHLRSVMRWVRFSNLDWLMLPGTACLIGPVSFWRRLLIQTLGPLAVLAVLGLPTLYVTVASMFGREQHPRYGPVTMRFIQSANIFLFLIYPATSAYIFSAFTCSDYGEDGLFLRADPRVDCNSSEYQRIAWYSGACVLLYPVGIPAYMMLVMMYHGVRRLAKEKLETAQFEGLLVLRKRQTSTRMRAMLANRFGWTADKEEFSRRVLALFHMGHEDHKEERTQGEVTVAEEQEETNMDWHELRAALAKFTDLPVDDVADEEVQALMDRYDPDRDGLSTSEMTTMLHDTVDQHCMFTDHEQLHNLSMLQLQSLRHHDWTLPSASLSTMDELHYTPDDEETKKFAVSVRSLRVAELGERYRLTILKRGSQREELIEWIRSKMAELDKSGALPQQPTSWREDSEEEKKAIQRLGFLFLSYRTNAWWFELVMLYYKLLMSSFLLLFEDSPIQIALGFLFTMVLLVIVLKTRPLVNQQLFNLQVLSLFVQTLNCFFGVMVKTGALSAEGNEDSSTSTALTGVFLLALNTFVVILPFVQVVTDYRILRLRYKSTITKMEKMNKGSAPNPVPKSAEAQLVERRPVNASTLPTFQAQDQDVERPIIAAATLVRKQLVIHVPKQQGDSEGAGVTLGTEEVVMLDTERGMETARD